MATERIIRRKRWQPITAAEARVGDFCEISGYWWRIVEFFPGIGDQVRGERNGREDTAFVRNVPRWRRSVELKNVV